MKPLPNETYEEFRKRKAESHDDTTQQELTTIPKRNTTKICKKCGNYFLKITFHTHKCYTLKEWEKFNKSHGGEIIGN